eukprot:CAMPEP_0168715040 /NCGR_PEP_ID=MMETSP0503-20121227/44997_1 /TAXON_ID=89963 /ORGANISM="Heterocapsa rotundata, Strain SCCAP K-0483" /LENGTH=109 /DNA_ID=CAMNT_0008761489 /DNA_START=1 /DNA_END=327 /DNA_ORIENTATION=-
MDSMRQNMQQMASRDAALQNMEAKTSELESTSASFSAGAGRLRRHQQWQQYKWYLLAFGGLDVLIIIAIEIFGEFGLVQFLVLAAAHVLGVLAVMFLGRGCWTSDEAAD